MHAPRVIRRTLPLLVALSLALAAVAPAIAADPKVTVTTAASPLAVTQGLPVAYPVTVSNDGSNTLNHVSLEGRTSQSLLYLGAAPAGACSETAPVCDFGQMPSGADREVTFYFLAPNAPGSFAFEAIARVNEGASDNPGAGHTDTFSATVQTTVLAVSADLVRGHSLPGFRDFSTGLNTVAAGNPHGTSVSVGSNTEVNVADVPPSAIDLACPAFASATCFGWASSLSIGGGAEFPEGIEVTVRWDATDVPTGVTDKKLRIIHLFDAGGYELVTDQCRFNGQGDPVSLPCLLGPAQRLNDKDLLQRLLLLENGLIRGWR
jgi:hypothetical protein